MQTFHVLTVTPGLPLRVYDRLMTSTQEALEELGASRVWVDPGRPFYAVMAELPVDDDADCTWGPTRPSSTDLESGL